MARMGAGRTLNYLRGFGNELESEAPGYEGALPERQTNPQRCNHSLFAEQLSGSAFTAPRHSNRRSWLYRKRPSVCHEPFERIDEREHNLRLSAGVTDPNQRRWTPFEAARPAASAETRACFWNGLYTLAYSDPDDGCSGAASVAIHIYLFTQSMRASCMVNSDGHLLLVPQTGEIVLETEFGALAVAPGEIAVVPQGVKFSVHAQRPDSSLHRGYVLEVRGNHFELPQLGPIGANCLANARDFEAPVAFVDTTNEAAPHEIILKFQNQLFRAKQDHSPYNVAGWFGNYYPFKYDLRKFVALNSVTVDHPDPSIFTVLTCPSAKPGTALADFVIFPPRWECARNTFRPPYFHRNCMTEFMGLIEGQYQAKSDKFAPGGGSLHHSMIAHGPDVDCLKVALAQDTSKPSRVADNTLAFMFETSLTLKLTNWALEHNVDHDYHKCWHGLHKLTSV